MPPLPIWFTGRDAVTRFLARRAFAGAGDMVLVPMAANGQPAVAEYRRAADGSCEHIRYMSWTLVGAGRRIDRLS
ncbi:MAG: polymerase sigma-70 factor, subfamily [Mycobacterium sp.]|nr:polymerase sigma-70 factor, subfamily [Mycobacterium sp.]